MTGDTTAKSGGGGTMPVYSITTNYFTSGTQKQAEAGSVVPAINAMEPTKEGYYLVLEDGSEMKIIGNFFIMPSQNVQYIGR